MADNDDDAMDNDVDKTSNTFDEASSTLQISSSAATGTPETGAAKPETSFSTPPKKVSDNTVSAEEDTTQIAGPLLNRFSSWRQQAKDTAVATLFRRSTPSANAPSSSLLMGRNLFQTKPNLHPIQTASLSPAPSETPSNAVPSPFFSKAREDDADVVEIVEEGDDDDPRSTSFASGGDDTIDYETASSVVSDSVFTDDSRTTHSRRGVTALQWAAASVVDSVQQSSVFRGRYSNRENSSAMDGGPPTPSSNLPSSPSSQTTKILSSSHRSYMESLMGRLTAPSEYVMLLGRGMLGVNLKQTFLKHQGVYVDYLVPRGSADRSAVIFVGDALVSVGSVDVRKGNIWTVPQTIASAPRPVHLVLSTFGTEIEVRVDRITYVDLCVGLLYHYGVLDSMQRGAKMEDGDRASYNDDDKREQRSPGSDSGEDVRSMDGETGQDSEEKPDVDDTQAIELISPTSFEEGESGECRDHDVEGVTGFQVPILETGTDFLTPGIPPRNVCEAISQHVMKRCNERSYGEIQDVLVQLSADNTNFRTALRNAFLSCVVDPRCFPFLAKHFTHIIELNDTGSFDNMRSNGSNDSDRTSKSSTMLMLFLDMINFSSLFPVSSLRRRKELADRIAYKYFLPSQVGESELVPPAFDFHYIVVDSSVRHLEKALKQPNLLTKDSFLDFQKAIVDALSNGRPFLSFIVSNECSRMRAHLRNTAPFVNVPFGRAVKQLITEDSLEFHDAKNFMQYLLVYLLTLKDKDSYGETEDLDVNKEDSKRINDAGIGLCMSLFIQKRLLPILRSSLQKENGTNLAGKIKEVLGQFWETFVEPIVKEPDSHFFDGSNIFESVVCLLKQLVAQIDADETPTFLGGDLVETLQAFSSELLYEYATNHHPNFQSHKIHEWYCEEAVHARTSDDRTSCVPRLNGGCIKRLLRKVEWPTGITPHKPSLGLSNNQDSMNVVNAECAIVFGNNSINNDRITRYCCVQLQPDIAGALKPEEVAPTIESYATVPAGRSKPFQNHQSSGLSIHADFDVSLVDFMVPGADVSSGDSGSALYGVSLVIRLQEDGTPTTPRMNTPRINSSFKEDDEQVFQEALDAIKTNVSFKDKLSETDWQRTASKQNNSVIGLALVSRRNVMLAMRDSLSCLARTLLVSNRDTAPSLVDILAAVSTFESSSHVFQAILKPYMEVASKAWLERPVDAQKESYIQRSGHQLQDSLLPIPLALLFVSALLEQKIVLSSSRRSILVSSVTALLELLKPLNWCHLVLPRVPHTLAADLIQYPAPFIIGVASEDPGMLDLIRDLPQDVTLVDLDVGRVILASSLSNNGEMMQGSYGSADEMSRALRLQVLYLAQSLGSVFGANWQPDLWLCDRLQAPLRSCEVNRFDKLRHVCYSFIKELVAGVPSCCFWVEESRDDSSSTMADPTILFDESRFFKFKSIRVGNSNNSFISDERDITKHLALSLEDFDLFLQLFVRCQSMNEYIGTRSKYDMAFSF